MLRVVFFAEFPLQFAKLFSLSGGNAQLLDDPRIVKSDDSLHLQSNLEADFLQPFQLRGLE